MTDELTLPRPMVLLGEALRPIAETLRKRMNEPPPMTDTAPNIVDLVGGHLDAAKARCGLRGYGWFQTLRSGGGAFIVSHFIVKKKQRADPKDVERAVAARETWR